MSDKQAPTRLIYVADPMCSWCWGFSPVMADVASRCAGRVPIDMVLGGLRPGTTEPMDADRKATIRGHWHHVAERTGQPFDFRLFDRDDFVYDTEPACRAVVTVRRLWPEAVLPMLQGIHQAFYAQARDTTRTEVLADIAQAIGMDRARFIEAFESDALREATQEDFRATAAMGVRGFPTLIAQHDDEVSLVTMGYRSADEVGPVIDDWLDRVVPAV